MMDGNRSDYWTQRSTNNQDDVYKPDYGSYPPPPEYFQSPSAGYPNEPAEPDAYFQSDAQPTRQSQPLEQQLGPDYYDQSPTNQLTDIRYDQPKKRSWAKAGGSAGVGIVALLAKFGAAIFSSLKFVLVFFKFGAASISILISLALYAVVFGWSFALGLVFLIFVHEMGHVIVLRAKGVPASAPIFIPFLGAFVAMKGMPPNAKDEAEIGIAGPLAGTLAALLCLLPFFAGSRIGLWPALAYFGFFMNLFNLIPVTPLDGGRIVGAISRKAWILGMVALVGVFLYELLINQYFNLFLLLIMIFAGSTAYKQFRQAPSQAAYYNVPLSTKIFISIAYFGLAAFLVVMMVYTRSLLPLAVGQ